MRVIIYNEGADEDEDPGPWPEIEDEVIFRVKGRGIWGQGGRAKKAVSRRYISIYQIPSCPAHFFPQQNCPGSK